MFHLHCFTTLESKSAVGMWRYQECRCGNRRATLRLGEAYSQLDVGWLERRFIPTTWEGWLERARQDRAAETHDPLDPVA